MVKIGHYMHDGWGRKLGSEVWVFAIPWKDGEVGTLQ